MAWKPTCFNVNSQPSPLPLRFLSRSNFVLPCNKRHRALLSHLPACRDGHYPLPAAMFMWLYRLRTPVSPCNLVLLSLLVPKIYVLIREATRQTRFVQNPRRYTSTTQAHHTKLVFIACLPLCNSNDITTPLAIQGRAPNRLTRTTLTHFRNTASEQTVVPNRPPHGSPPAEYQGVVSISF